MNGRMRENLLSSLERWNGIVVKTDAEEVFYNWRGFEGINVVDRCGYCEEFCREFHHYYYFCDHCPLHKKNICNNSSFYSDYLLWQYVGMMRKIADKHKQVVKNTSKTNGDWVEVKALARKIRDGIVECNRKLWV